METPPAGEVWEGFKERRSGKSEDLAMTSSAMGNENTAVTEPKAGKCQKRKGKDHVLERVSVETSSNSFNALNNEIDQADDTTPETDGKLTHKPNIDSSAEVLVSAWDNMGLSSTALSSLARMKFSKPTAIQQASVPEILSGHDLIGKAPTGSGKTLAYGLPIYEHFLKIKLRQVAVDAKSNSGAHPPIALVLSPTRELAHQLSTHLKNLCSDPNTPIPIIATVTGGLSVYKQQRFLAQADIIIGTPGRSLEVISGSAELSRSLRYIQFLVVDEADRLLSEGHFPEVEEILRILDKENELVEGESGLDGHTLRKGKQRQTLVFSATFRKDLQQKLSGKSKSLGGDPINKKESLDYLLKKLNFQEEEPKFINVNPISQMASGLREGIVECAGTDKVR